MVLAIRPLSSAWPTLEMTIDHAAHGHPKVGLLGNVELAVVHQLVEPITVYSTLFGSKKVMDGAHDLLVPLTVGVPNLESSVKVVSQL